MTSCAVSQEIVAKIEKGFQGKLLVQLNNVIQKLEIAPKGHGKGREKLIIRAVILIGKLGIGDDYKHPIIKRFMACKD